MKQNEPVGSILTPYKQAVDELKVKLKGLRKQYEVGEHNSPIEFVTGRVKPISSVIDKANKRVSLLTVYMKKCTILLVLELCVNSWMILT